MKKHILRTLVVMLMACLGVGILAACGGKATDPIEGVWTGTTGEAANVTITIDVEGDSAHMVQKVEGGYYYIALTQAADGGYSYTQGDSVITVKLSEENKLEIKNGTTTAVFETKASLPSAPNITGTKYATFNDEDVEITFGNTPAIKLGDTSLTEVKLINVGAYKVFTAKNGQNSVQVVAYQEQSKNYAFFGGESYELSDTAPTPPPATATIEGYWTGATAGNIAYTASVKVVDDEAYAVVEAKSGNSSYYFAKILSKQTDGSYKLEEAVSGSSSGDGTHTTTTVNTYTYTGKLDANGKLVVTIPGALVSSTAGEEVTLTFTTKADLPAGISPTGTLYPTTVHFPITLDFTNKKVIEGTTELTGPKFVNVGSYVVIGGKISMQGVPEQTLCFAVLQKQTKYYLVGLDRYGYTWELTDTKPVGYSVVFSFGDPSHAASEVEVPEGYSNRDVGETIDLPEAWAEEGWKFDGWFTKNNTKVEGERGYTINPADAEGTTITLTAHWSENDEPGPTPTTTIEGVWTGATASGIFGDGSFDITAVIELAADGNSGYMVVLAKAAEAATADATAPADYALACAITKTDDHYTGTLEIFGGDTFNLTITLEENTLSVADFGDDTLNFATTEELSEPIDMPTGTLYADMGDNVALVFNFTDKMFTAPEAQPVQATYVNVGEYIVVIAPMGGIEISCVIYKDGSTYYYFGGEEPLELTETNPMSYTVNFDLGEPAEAYGDTQTPTPVPEKADGEQVTLPTDITPAADWVLEGWYTKSGRKVEGTSYAVDPADAAGGVITLTARWAVPIASFTGNGWNGDVKKYPNHLKVGDVLTLTGGVELLGQAGDPAPKKDRWDGVQIALSTNDFVTDRIAFAYDWRVNGAEAYTQKAAMGYLNITLNPGDWVVGLDTIAASGTNLTVKAVITRTVETLVQVVYTIKGTVNSKEETFTITYNVPVAADAEVAIGVVCDDATLTDGKFVCTNEVLPAIADTMDKTNITVGTSNASAYNTDTHSVTLKPGQTLTVKGNLQTSGTENYSGFGVEMTPYGVANLIEANGPFNFRLDNCCTRSDGWAFDVENCTKYNLHIAKHYEYNGSPDIADKDWAAFVAAKANIEVTATIAWTEADQIVVTFAFSNCKVAGYEAYSRTQTYTVTPMNDGTHLANAYTFTFSPDLGYIANATAQITYNEIV